LRCTEIEHLHATQGFCRRVERQSLVEVVDANVGADLSDRLR
jgi:hypothetical protein